MIRRFIQFNLQKIKNNANIENNSIIDIIKSKVNKVNKVLKILKIN